MRWIEGVLSLDGTLGKKERMRRILLLLIMTVCAMFTMFALFSYRNVGFSGRPVAVGALTLHLLLCIFPIVCLLCKRPLTDTLIKFVAAGWCVTMLSTDLSARTTSRQSWPFLVLVVDFLLVMQVQGRFVWYIVVVSLVYLLVVAAEETTRFGVLDLPGLVPQSSRWERLQ